MSSIEKPILANRDYEFEDYHEDITLGTYQAYQVGENNILGGGTQNKLFISKSTLIMCTEDCYIKFNSANNVVNTILADVYYTFKHNIRSIHYADVDVAGTIYIWCEGVLPEDARSAR